MNRHNWWQNLSQEAQSQLVQMWVPIGRPGYAGEKKDTRRQLLNERFGEDGWRTGHYVRGRIVSEAQAIREYEESYRLYLQRNPQMVIFLASSCGNVYDTEISNVYDSSYHQPETVANHYQDIAVRRIMAELADNLTWPTVQPTPQEEVELVDLNSGGRHLLPRAYGFAGEHLLQIREPDSPGFFLSPAVVPVHDPSLVITHPHTGDEWYLQEGCRHLSVEAFWQMSKVIQVRYDRFLAIGVQRLEPLNGI